ncbi:MAG TPA: hypothetical protein VHX38_21135 [Pseudonocardiaceae bacterium]|nr:hypothetical protein [Pseudonocardiaceae bacterium]
MAVGLVGVLVACSGGNQPANPTKVPTFASSPSSAPPFAGKVPASCDPVARFGDVNAAVGHQLTGTANQIVGIPEASIGRTARLDCYYGIPPNQAITTGVLSIGISSYGTQAQAQHRVLETVNEARDTGYVASTVRVGAMNADLLAGTSQEIVLSAGNLTILVSAANGVLAAGNIGPALIALATKALNAAQHA